MTEPTRPEFTYPCGGCGQPTTVVSEPTSEALKALIRCSRCSHPSVAISTSGAVVDLGEQIRRAAKRLRPVVEDDEGPLIDPRVLSTGEQALIERRLLTIPERFRDAVPTSEAAWVFVESLLLRQRGESLLLLGPTGTGKTYTGFGILRAAIAGDHSLGVEWGSLPRLLAATTAGAEGDAAVRRLIHAEVLFIDDLGAEKITEHRSVVLYSVIDGRYAAMRPTIVSTNLSTNRLGDYLDDRIVSRLLSYRRATMTGPDRRVSDLARGRGGA